jgi:hypothetical protein
MIESNIRGIELTVQRGIVVVMMMMMIAWWTKME